ncbi:MAG TPA: cytochrome c biogenesis protein CcdA [Tepidisphaeraceae bacterium]|jgi:thiol:disulfide interchange protein DsbD|nr:cytochrome c biogenesis protein CcdA [Tepidisphaeraceae bacterium]
MMNPRKLASGVIGLILLALCAGPAHAARQYIEIKQAVANFSALQPGQQAVAAVVMEVKKGFHAQSHTPRGKGLIAFTVKVTDSPAITMYAPIYPAGLDEKDNTGTLLSVYTGQVTLYLPFQIKTEAAPGPVKISGTIHYQACNDDGCFLPTDLPFTIESKIVPAGQAIEPQDAALFKDLPSNVFYGTAAAAAAPEPVEKLFGRFELRSNSYLLAFIAAFLAGIIFNAVPCVLPVLPLKAIGFYEVSQHNRAKCLAFGAVFSLGLIASFGVLALFIVVYKTVGWGQIYSNVWFNIAIVVILLVMAVGTFGAFSVNLPVGIYRITPRHDTYLGNFLFGILTAILSTPCTFGLFFTLLVWAGKQPTSIAVAVVMTVGAGMAFPYFLLSAAPELARKFPRTGPWSELVKQSMSFLLLGSAVFFARSFIQPYTGEIAFWWILFAVAVVMGLFIFIRSISISGKFVARFAAAIIAVAIIGGSYAVAHDLVQQPFAWTDYSDKTLESARHGNRVVVLDFTATWCTTCQYLEAHTLYSPQVVKAVKSQDITMMKADLTSEKAEGWTLLHKSASFTAIPLTQVYGPGVSEPIQLSGIYSPQALIDAIEKAGKKKVAAGDRSID